MAANPRPRRVALVVHPTRPIASAIETLQRWAARQGLDVVQIPAFGGTDREVARQGEIEPGDLVVALGGDGTVLSGLRASAPSDAPVLGVACGSLGALTAVPADRLDRALERVLGGDWTPRRLPALAIQPMGAPDVWAVNDFVVVRRGAGQVVATPLGSSAYSMAAGGPLLAPGAPAIVCTPVSMHGGHAPPLVAAATAEVRVQVHPGWAGFEVELDGHAQPLEALDYRLSVHEEKVTLVSFAELGLGLTGLRERGLITDSPRVLARDGVRTSWP